MENIIINDNNNNQQEDLYKAITNLNTKYNLLEKKLKEKDEEIDKNKKYILIINKTLISFENKFLEFKKNFEKDINGLREKIENQKKEKKYGEINYTDNDLLNKIKSEFKEKSKNIEKKLEDLTTQIKEIKMSQINKEELKIVENKNITVFQSFENLLAMIISQGDIDSYNFEKLEKIVEKLKLNNISPNLLANNFFSDMYKYSSNKTETDKNYQIKLVKLQETVNKAIDEIENELKQKNKNSIEQKTKGESLFSRFKKKIFS